MGLKHLFLQADLASFTKHSGNPGVFLCGVDANDAFYLPSGWAFAEQNHEQSNLGIKINVICLGESLYALKHCSEYMHKRNAGNSALKQAIADRILLVPCCV